MTRTPDEIGTGNVVDLATGERFPDVWEALGLKKPTPDELRDEAARQGRLCQEAWNRRDYEAAKRHLARARELTLEAANAETPPDLMDGAEVL